MFYNEWYGNGGDRKVVQNTPGLPQGIIPNRVAGPMFLGLFYKFKKFY
jgi:hypothetical protein